MIKARFTEPFLSFVPNTHKLYVSRHWINSVYPAENTHESIEVYILN